MNFMNCLLLTNLPTLPLDNILRHLSYPGFQPRMTTTMRIPNTRDVSSTRFFKPMSVFKVKNIAYVSSWTVYDISIFKRVVFVCEILRDLKILIAL